jgi:hypothetical protein
VLLGVVPWLKMPRLPLTRTTVSNNTATVLVLLMRWLVLVLLPALGQRRHLHGATSAMPNSSFASAT